MLPRNVFIMFCLLSVAIGCQKEYSFEKGQFAKGSLQSDVSGDCLPKKVNGVYKQSTQLTSGNTVEVTINVTIAGSYQIKTNIVNGYSFSGSGSFSSVGLITVTLQGSGHPLRAGVDSFTVRFDSSVCVLPITVVSNNTPAANYTLVSGGTPPNCASAVVHGTYELNGLTDATHFAEVQVNVTTPGTSSLTPQAVD